MSVGKCGIVWGSVDRCGNLGSALPMYVSKHLAIAQRLGMMQAVLSPWLCQLDPLHGLRLFFGRLGHHPPITWPCQLNPMHVLLTASTCDSDVLSIYHAPLTCTWDPRPRASFISLHIKSICPPPLLFPAALSPDTAPSWPFSAAPLTCAPRTSGSVWISRP